MPQGMGKQKDLGFGKDLQGVQSAQDALGFLQVQLVQRALVDQGAPGDLGSLLVLVHPAVCKTRVTSRQSKPFTPPPQQPKAGQPDQSRGDRSKPQVTARRSFQE